MSKFNFVDWLRIDCGFVIMDLQDFIIVDLTGFFDIVGNRFTLWVGQGALQ